MVGPRCRPISVGVCLSLQCRGFNTGTVISVILFFLLCSLLIKDGTRAGLSPSACPHKAGLIPGSEK